MQHLVRDKSFYKLVFGIAIPIAFQNLITLATSMMDTVMLGRADDTGVFLSASSLANQPFFILSLIGFGLAGAGTVLAAQYWGKRDMAPIRAIFAMVLKAAFVLSCIMASLVLFLPEWVMGLYSSSPAIIAAGADYLRILGFAYLTFGLSNTMVCLLRSVERVKISVVVNSVSFCTNVFLNWVLIFGNLGAPALGIRGAAIATLVARLLEFFITFFYVFVIDRRLCFRPRHLLLFDRTLAKDLLRHGTPVLVNEVMWSLGTTLQAAILGHITYSAGDPVGANTIASMVQQLSTVIIFGVANATAVVVGKAIGEGKLEEARRRAYTLTYLSVGIGVLACGVILLANRAVVNIYDIPEATKELARQLMVVVAVVTFFVSLSSVSIMGTLRGAGDTRFCLTAEMICLWLVALPLAALAAFALHWPVPLVLVCMKIDEPLKALICLIRLRGRKWLNTLTRSFEGAGTGSPEAGLEK